MILEPEHNFFRKIDPKGFTTTTQLLKILEKRNQFKNDLVRIFNIDLNKPIGIKVGNAKNLIQAIVKLDSQCDKIDITSKMKDIYLEKMLDQEKAIFSIFNIEDKKILRITRSNTLEVETRYSAKSDLLNYYDFNKFASYCRDMQYEDLINTVVKYLKRKNRNNEDEKSLRLILNHADKKFYLRGITSSHAYKDFGINFSVFVSLMALDEYVNNSKNDVFVSRYNVTDSDLYVSFAFNNQFKVNDDMSLSFNLILENDEIKRNAVSFNGLFKLKFQDKKKSSEIYLKPSGVRKKNSNIPVDLLTYQHRGNVEGVFDKIQDLPELIDFFIEQVKSDAKAISKIKAPDDIRKYIAQKVKNAKKPEFKKYKGQVFNKLMKITVSNTFQLFELLREVEELFEHDDVISLGFWRSKLYEVLITKK